MRDSQGLNSPTHLVDSFVHRRAKGFQQAVGHVRVDTLVMHQRSQAVCLEECRRRASPQGEGVFDASHGELPVSLALWGAIARELEAGECDCVRCVVKVGEANSVRHAPKTCGEQELARDPKVAFDLPARRPMAV